METTVYLVRHCEASGNADGTVQGITDNEITEKGRRQLRVLSALFRDIPLDVVYTSPLGRTIATAEAANTFWRAPMIVEPGLLEIDFGRLEKQVWDELKTICPGFIETWNTHMWDLVPPEGESMRHVYERLPKAFWRCVNAARGKRILLSGHGCAFRNLLCALCGKPIEQIYEIPWLDNTSLSCLQIDEADRVTPVYMGKADHLLPEQAEALLRTLSV